MDRLPEPSQKNARFGKRLSIRCSLVVAKGVQVGEGWVFDLSMRGCLVDGSVRAKAGDRLQLRLCLPDSHPSICVSAAVVRWAQGRRFGVEFMRVDDKYRAYLKRLYRSQVRPLGKGS